MGAGTMSSGITGNAVLHRLRQFAFDGRTISGLVAGALLGMLAAELGIRNTGWDFTFQDVLLLAFVSAIGSSFGRFLRFLWIADAALLVLVGLISLTPILSGFTTRWVRTDTVPSTGVDAVVVPSSMITSSGTLAVTGSDRLLAGLELIRRGVAPKLVTTRAPCCGTNVGANSDVDQRRLVALAGVTKQWVLVGDAGGSTHEEALAIDRRLRELGARRIAVVTSPLHTRRACATFEGDGMGVTCVPALERGDQTRSPQNGSDRLAAFRAYVYERMGWWLYRRRGWVAAP
jgi:uncharacterized SAM-binding protein YcdF (DUF218 family)